jgi:hypothetical protein
MSAVQLLLVPRVPTQLVSGRASLQELRKVEQLSVFSCPFPSMFFDILLHD